MSRNSMTAIKQWAVVSFQKTESHIVRFGRQAGDAETGVALGADVEADEQRGDLLYDAGVFELAAIDGAHAGNFTSERADALRGRFVIAADDYVAIHWAVVVQEFG